MISDVTGVFVRKNSFQIELKITAFQRNPRSKKRKKKRYRSSWKKNASLAKKGVLKNFSSPSEKNHKTRYYYLANPSFRTFSWSPTPFFFYPKSLERFAAGRETSGRLASPRKISRRPLSSVSFWTRVCCASSFSKGVGFPYYRKIEEETGELTFHRARFDVEVFLFLFLNLKLSFCTVQVFLNCLSRWTVENHFVLLFFFFEERNENSETVRECPVKLIDEKEYSSWSCVLKVLLFSRKLYLFSPPRKVIWRKFKIDWKNFLIISIVVRQSIQKSAPRIIPKFTNFCPFFILMHINLSKLVNLKC